MTFPRRTGILVSEHPMRSVPLAAKNLRYDRILPIILSTTSDFEQSFLRESVRLSRLVLVFQGRCPRHLLIA
jgi:hypothetical protein